MAAAGAPVLAMVPHLSTPAPVITVSLALRAGETDVTLAPEWTEEREVALEAFRTLAVDLRFVGESLGIGRFRTVAVTSASSGEGKTFTAANLAIVRASHGTRTCLVDADLRAGGVQRFFGWPPMLGLSEVLTCEADLRFVTRSAKIAGRNSLSVVPAGAVSSRSAELLEHRSFERAISSLRDEHEFIVVDTPPLNVLPDAASVVSVVDAVVVVVRSGVTERTALELTLERLQRAGATIAGVVLNDAALPGPYSSYTYASAESEGRGGRSV
jgi:capsular exopolysaccharide synthesis family protein